MDRIQIQWLVGPLKFRRITDKCCTQYCNTYENRMLSEMLQHLSTRNIMDKINNK
jgi:hypothetical protein